MDNSIAASDVRVAASPPASRRVPVKFRKTVRMRRPRSGPLLSGGRTDPTLSHEAWSELRRIWHPASFPAGQTVFVEGQPCRGVYFLRQGRAKLSIGSPEGRTLIVRIVGPGEILSLNSCLTGGLHDTTLETTQPTEFAFVRRNDFLQFLTEHKDASYLAGEQLMRDYRGAYELVRSLGLAHSTTQKLARFLLQWADENPAQDGVCHLRSRFTHDEIGQMVGATRETITRGLGLLRKEHVIDFSDAGLLICDRTALEQMAS
jgi:CRP/FNR family transcriptional regulator, cyclic AMP receptor protein